MINAYTSLSTGSKRLVWVGYFAYLLWMNLMGGWDLIIDGALRPITYNPFIALGIMLTLYWLVVLLILWVLDGFSS